MTPIPDPSTQTKRSHEMDQSNEAGSTALDRVNTGLATSELGSSVPQSNPDVRPPMDDHVDINRPTGVRMYILFAAVFFSAFLMSLNGSIVATAIPQITSHFHLLEDIGWYGSAYLISTCSLQPLVGKFYTHFPVKQTYMTFSFIFFIGSLLAATAASSKMLIGGRALQGVGGAGIMNGALTTISAASPRDSKPLLVGIGIGLGTIGSVIGPTIGGAITQNISWRWCFYINLPPGGLVLLILSLAKIPEQTEKKPVRSNLKSIITEELDLVGFVLFAPACIMFLLAMVWGGNQYRWDSSTIIGLFCGAFVTILIFAAWEYRRGEKAMIPPKFARNRLVVFGCCTSCFQMGAMMLLSYYLPLWFQVVKSKTPTMSGVDVLPTAISQSVAAVVAGKFVQVVGYCTPWAAFGSMLTSIGSGLITTLNPSSGAGDWIGYQILIGTGRAPVLQMPVTAIQSLLPAKEVAMATSQVFFFQYLGAATFIAIGETIFLNTLRSALQTDAPNANAEAIIGAGASAVRSVVSEADLPGVLRAYNHAITQTFHLAVGGSCAAFFTSFGMGWQRLPKKEKNIREIKKESEGDAA